MVQTRSEPLNRTNGILILTYSISELFIMCSIIFLIRSIWQPCLRVYDTFDIGFKIKFMFIRFSFSRLPFQQLVFFVLLLLLLLDNIKSFSLLSLLLLLLLFLLLMFYFSVRLKLFLFQFKSLPLFKLSSYCT